MIIPWEELPRKTMSSGVLLFNSKNEFIITKPNYKPGWNIPGGQVDLEESPTEACVREVEEELGLANKHPLALLCLDYRRSVSNEHDHLNFVFDGGHLTDEEIATIVLQTAELDEYRFVTLEQAMELLAPSWAKRMPKCVAACETKRIVYLEDGEDVMK